MTGEHAAYDELCAYTLTHGAPAFIHQHVVDAFTAQHADEETKPIAITFALVGLYLHLEKQFTGRAVQLAHMKMAKKKRLWPRLVLPAERGTITAVDVMTATAGPERDRAIDEWCGAVWEPYRDNAAVVRDLLSEYDII